METLTGAQKTKLRGMGQRLDAMLMIGQAGVTATVLVELNKLINTHELVKVRFTGADRDQRAILASEVAEKAPAFHVGSVGATALFFRRNADPKKQSVEL